MSAGKKRLYLQRPALSPGLPWRAERSVPILTVPPESRHLVSSARDSLRV